MQFDVNSGFSRTIEHFPDTLLQPLQAVRRNPSPRGFMPSQAIPQKLPLPRVCHHTLGRVDLELEAFREKPRQVCQHPLSRHLASDIDITVVKARRLNRGSPYWITVDQEKELELRDWVRNSSRIQTMTDS